MVHTYVKIEMASNSKSFTKTHCGREGIANKFTNIYDQRNCKTSKRKILEMRLFTENFYKISVQISIIFS